MIISQSSTERQSEKVLVEVCRAKMACATASRLGGRHPKAPCYLLVEGEKRTIFRCAFRLMFPKPVTYEERLAIASDSLSSLWKLHLLTCSH